MERQAVTSSNVASVGYDGETLTLEIEFNNGTVYQYFDVTEQIYNELISAGSVGAYLAANIKGRFRFSKV
ncbi:KTSC domain-containing protein [Acidovorax cavernicola]|uniref:KTSC domain-containing protein n=1 Tax=Acidovorax cavernicola TaxID=1675792 RepID=A0A9X8D1K4_9BURK|nr:KTSC domain-containing protein [Acidovorax cavernicola]RIX76312.1 KTSC domain-containing protein [Acidovorax cavernicola]